MFVINEDKSIYATRGDIVFFGVTAKDIVTGEKFVFKPGDVLRMKIYAKKNAENVVMQKYFGVYEESEQAEIYLEEADTKIGDVISKPVTYWYEIELNPDTAPQTIIGYNEDGAVPFVLYPEGADIPEKEITEEDIPIIDSELDISSTRPVENQAVAKAIAQLSGKTELGVITVDDSGAVDTMFEQALAWYKAGIPIMVVKNQVPPAFVTGVWNDEKIYFKGGAHKTGYSDSGFVTVKFPSYSFNADGTFEDTTESFALSYVGGSTE